MEAEYAVALSLETHIERTAVPPTSLDRQRWQRLSVVGGGQFRLTAERTASVYRARKRHLRFPPKGRKTCLQKRTLRSASCMSALYKTRLQSLILLVFASRCLAGMAENAQIFKPIRPWGIRPAVANVATLSTQKAVKSAVVHSSDIDGSVLDDTVVQKNCSLHIRGNLLGSLTIESGAKVVVEGSVDGKIMNRGGKLVVNNKAHASCITTDGPAETEACGILKDRSDGYRLNWDKLANHARLNAPPWSKATPTAAASNQSRARWPKPAVSLFLSPISRKPNVFARLRRTRPFMFSVDWTRGTAQAFADSQRATRHP